MTRVFRKKSDKSWSHDVPKEKAFTCSNTRVVNKLVVALHEMSEETFRLHVTIGKNDISRWVREVIGDVTLAMDLKKAVIPADAAEKVETRLGRLRTK